MSDKTNPVSELLGAADKAAKQSAEASDVFAQTIRGIREIRAAVQKHGKNCTHHRTPDDEGLLVANELRAAHMQSMGPRIVTLARLCTNLRLLYLERKRAGECGDSTATLAAFSYSQLCQMVLVAAETDAATLVAAHGKTIPLDCFDVHLTNLTQMREEMQDAGLLDFTK